MPAGIYTALTDLNLVIECFDDPVSIFDLEFRCVALNSKLAEAVRQADGTEIAIGMNILDHFSPASGTEQIRKIFEGETIEEEFEYKSSNGEILFLQCVYKPVRSNDTIIGGFRIVKNITQARQNEKALEESRRLYHQLAANIPDTDLFLTDLDLNILLAEGHSIKKLGLDPSFFRGRSVFEVLKKFLSAGGSERALNEAYMQLKENGASSSVEFIYNNHNYLFQTVALLNEKGERSYNLILFRDVTAQKTIEQNLLKINRSKDNILGIVAHDLRNPISSILGLLDLIQHHKENSAEYLDLISKSSQNCLNIINDLLDITALDASDTLKKVKVEINSFIKGIIDAHATFIGDKELNVNFHSSHEKIYVIVSAIKIARVFNNLLMNAIKFSYRGKSINIATNLEDGILITTVKDEGMGIPEDMQHIIFDKFTKASRQGTEGEKSMGLGMSIVKRIIELHDGHIYMQSQENKGTIFFIRLPGAMME